MSGAGVIVVGGGIVGLSTAYFLSRRGIGVTLLEREAFLEGSASTGNAGFIVPGHPPLPRPGLTRQAMRMLLDEANPLYVPPRWDPSLVRWLWQFRRACTASQFEHSMGVLAEFGWVAAEAFDQLIADESIACDYHRDGWLEVFDTRSRLEHGREDAAILKRYGYTFEEMSGEALRDREPAFRENVIGAISYRESGYADPERCVAGLAERVQGDGVTIRRGAGVSRLIGDGGRVRGVALEDGSLVEGDCVVVAAGIWSEQLARTVGVRVPMQPAKGYHVNLSMPDPAPSGACLLAEAFVAVNPACGGLRLAGTLEFSGINHRVNERRLNMLRVNAARFLRGVSEARVESTWCGLRPCTADGLPVIGWAPGVENVFLATGHAMLGFGLGPGTGRVAAEAIAGARPSVDLSAMSPARFG